MRLLLVLAMLMAFLSCGEQVKDNACNVEGVVKSPTEFFFKNESFLLTETEGRTTDEAGPITVSSPISKVQLDALTSYSLNGTSLSPESFENLAAIAMILPRGYFSGKETRQIFEKDILGFVTYSYRANSEKYKIDVFNFQNKKKFDEGCSPKRLVIGVSPNDLYQIGHCLNGIESDFFLAMEVTNIHDRARLPNVVPHEPLGIGLNGQKAPLGGPLPSCGGDCHTEKHHRCLYDPLGGPSGSKYFCFPITTPTPGCLTEAVEDTVKYYAASAKTAFMDDLYAFRDIYLSASSKGQNYTSMYYELSSELDISSVSFTTLYNSMVLSIDLTPRFNKLVDYKNGNTALGQDVLYDSVLKTDVVDVIDDLLLSSGISNRGIEILNAVKSDVILYEGKTVSQIDALMAL